MTTQNFEPIHFPELKDQIHGKNPLLGALFLLCILLFFVCFLYKCSRRRDRGGDPDAPPGLDPDAIGSLPVSLYGSKPSPGAECAICLGLFREGDGVKVLPLCRHGFHSECVDRWLKTRSSCPLCRERVCPPG